MKIAIPTADYPPIEGGISSVSLHLSRALAALGHEVTVIAPWFPDMKSFDHDEPVEVLRFRGYGLSWFRFFPMFRAALSPMHRADLVLAINISYGGIMAWLMGA
ncbi:MAG: glycosyltransferase, partial [Candidatus Hydrogenedentota bacterium]